MPIEVIADCQLPIFDRSESKQLVAAQYQSGDKAHVIADCQLPIFDWSESKQLVAAQYQSGDKAHIIADCRLPIGRNRSHW